jgi:hypothetical protein
MHNRLPLLLAIAAQLAAQSAARPPRDIDGWDQVKWGMTLDQVRQLYPTAKASANTYWSHLTLPAIQAGEIPLQVAASARRPTTQVTLIALWCYFGLPAGTPGAAPQLTARDFDSLKTAMIRKYGSPRDESRSTEYDDVVHTYLWVFPSGSIDLKLKVNRKVPTLGSFHVAYRAASPAPL